MLMITVLFGLPGHGKTTYLARIACKYLKRKNHGFIYSNVDFALPEIVRIDPVTDTGNYEIFNGICIFDEASQIWDSRNFKSFPKSAVKFFNEHRHHHVSNIYCAVQKYDALDIKIRNVAERCLWVRAYFPHTPLSLTRVWKIPRSILIANSADASKLSGGEIISGYTQPGFFSRIFTERFFGRKYWKLFNSFVVEVLPPLPAERFQDENHYQKYMKLYEQYKCETEIKNKKILEEIQKLSPLYENGKSRRRQRRVSG